MSTHSRLLKGWLSSEQEVDWEAVYTEHMPHLYNYFRYRVGDDLLAEDLTAATFEKAWTHRRRYRRDLAAFSTWLFTIARNQATDHFRRQQREEPRDDIAHLTKAPSVEETIQQRDDGKRLSALLRRLPEREQELVALKYGAGLTNRDIARQTGLSETNVGTILHRVVQALRLKWEVDA